MHIYRLASKIGRTAGVQQPDTHLEYSGFIRGMRNSCAARVINVGGAESNVCSQREHFFDCWEQRLLRVWLNRLKMRHVIMIVPVQLHRKDLHLRSERP